MRDHRGFRVRQQHDVKVLMSRMSKTELKRRFVRRSGTHRWLFGMLGLVVVWMAIGPFVVPAGAAPLGVIIVMFWSLVIVVALRITSRLLGRRPDYTSLKVRRLLESGQCPGCLYKVWTVNPEPDGCTVCPECGAAWRVEPVDA